MRLSVQRPNSRYHTNTRPFHCFRERKFLLCDWLFSVIICNHRRSIEGGVARRWCYGTLSSPTTTSYLTIRTEFGSQFLFRCHVDRIGRCIHFHVKWGVKKATDCCKKTLVENIDVAKYSRHTFACKMQRNGEQTVPWTHRCRCDPFISMCGLCLWYDYFTRSHCANCCNWWPSVPNHTNAVNLHENQSKKYVTAAAYRQSSEIVFQASCVSPTKWVRT